MGCMFCKQWISRAGNQNQQINQDAAHQLIIQPPPTSNLDGPRTHGVERNRDAANQLIIQPPRTSNLEGPRTHGVERNRDAVKPRTEADPLQIHEEQRCENTTEPEKCYDPLDSTLTFVNKDDELDDLCIGYKSLRARMSCGHAVTPMSLTNHCRRLIEKGKKRFVCGVFGCDAVWSFEEVCKMALLTPEEIDDFQKKMFGNVKHFLDIKSCPRCKSNVMRKDKDDLSVYCPVCTAEKGRDYIFCWQCLKKWKGPLLRSGRCGNDGCGNFLETLRTCPEITLKDVEGVTGCPAIRACPTCGVLVGHDTTACKSVTCHRCEVKFCFVCLKITEECLETSSNYKPCSSGVAPRQTSIPVWQNK